MDLWVRSQDKTNLIKVYDVYITERSKIRANFQKGYGCAYTELGEYATEERALKVLDEIESILCYKRLEQYSGYSIINVENNVAVYEMPKE